jgi:hypothetical protein
MKAYSKPEFWFCLILGLSTVVGAVGLVVFGKDVFSNHGHETALGWFAFLLVVPLYLLTASCFFWEWLLLKERARNPVNSLTKPVVVFSIGMIPVLGIIGFITN